MEYYRLILYVSFGILPVLPWLFYYLKKDLHPEPKRMILRIFLLGCLVTIPVYFLQVALADALNQVQIVSWLGRYPLFFDLIQWFVIIAFIEELFKFLVVKLSIFKSRYLDEPMDIMIYMVVAALGFAAVENTLYLLAPLGNISFTAIIETTVAISFIRFIGATLLHTLCSALLGYYVVLGFCKGKRSIGIFWGGLLLASAFHGLYDFAITSLPNPLNIALPVTIILALFVIMIYNFNRASKIKSVCKI